MAAFTSLLLAISLTACGDGGDTPPPAPSGLRPATRLEVFAGGFDMPLLLTWWPGDDRAEAIRLERRIVQFDGVTEPWAELVRLPPEATSYVDADVATWRDGASFEYRIIYVKGGAESDPAVVRNRVQSPPLAPADLSAAGDGVTSIRLDWSPRSRYATHQVVLRGGVEVAELPRDAATYVDTVPVPGTFMYRISARLSPYSHISNDVGDSDPALGFTTLPDLPLEISAASLPQGEQVARDAHGRFATAWAVSRTLGIWRETEAGWVARDTLLADEYPDLATPGILFGPDDRLHVLYTLFPNQTPMLLHEWFEGTWQAETIAVRWLHDAVFDGAGALHIVACSGGTAAAYATNASGAWVHEPLPASRYPHRCTIAIGPDGDVRVAYSSQREAWESSETSRPYDIYLLTRGRSRWTEELVQLGPDAGTAAGAGVLRAFAPSAAETVLVYDLAGFNGAPDLVRSIACDRAGWGAPVAVGVADTTIGLAAAMSPDRSRVALAWRGTRWVGHPATLALRDAAGGWSSWALHDSAGPALGFSPAGDLWVLDGPGESSLLYEER